MTRKILFFPTRFCPSGQLGKPAHVAHIVKPHEPTLKPKLAKECNFYKTFLQQRQIL